MSSRRVSRINEEMKREISKIIGELKDPRLSHMISVVNVNTSNDCSYAKVYISVMGDKQVQNDAIKALKNASGFIRKELGHKIRLRYIPELNFVLDDSIKHGVHISQLLNDMMPLEGELDNNDNK